MNVTDKEHLSPHNILKINQGLIDRSDADQHAADIDKKGLEQLDERLNLVLQNTVTRVLPDKPAHKDLPLGDELHCNLFLQNSKNYECQPCRSLFKKKFAALKNRVIPDLACC